MDFTGTLISAIAIANIKKIAATLMAATTFSIKTHANVNASNQLLVVILDMFMILLPVHVSASPPISAALLVNTGVNMNVNVSAILRSALITNTGELI